MDPITLGRLEFVSTAMITNQTPTPPPSIGRKDKNLQIETFGTALHLHSTDPKIIYNIPRSITKLILAPVDGEVEYRCKRQMEMAMDRRGNMEGTKIVYAKQRSDDLNAVSDGTVDIVYSMTGVEEFLDKVRNPNTFDPSNPTGVSPNLNPIERLTQFVSRSRSSNSNNNSNSDSHGDPDDWIVSLRESARVLRNGGRFVFVEPTKIDGTSFVRALEEMVDIGEDGVSKPVFEVAYDDVDYVFQPHVAGVATRIGGVVASSSVKRSSRSIGRGTGKTTANVLEDTDFILETFERGRKKKKKKRKEE